MQYLWKATAAYRWLIDWLMAQRSLRLQQWGFKELDVGLQLQNNNNKKITSLFLSAQTNYELLDLTLAAALDQTSSYSSKSFNGAGVWR